MVFSKKTSFWEENMKKLLSVILASVMVMSLVACGQQSQPAATEAPAAEAEAPVEAAPEKRTVRVGVSIYTFDDAFMTLYRNELARYFESKNNDQVTYEVTMQDGKNDQAEQTNQIDNFIAQGYDVLILNLVQSTSAATVMDKCAAAGIPVIFINREPSESDMQSHNTGDYAGKYTYVGADARQSGRFQGELIFQTKVILMAMENFNTL